MTLAAAPEAWQGAMAAGLLGMGTVVAGSSEVAGRLLVALLARRSAARRLASRNGAIAGLKRLVAAKQKVPGLGHPQHSDRRPARQLLLKFADERGVSGDHVRMLRLLGKHAQEITGRKLPINVTGAIPAVMLDVGYPLEAIEGAAAPCPHRRARRASLRRIATARSASSCRTTPTRRSPTTARSQPQPNRSTSMAKVLRWSPRHRDGDLHHRDRRQQCISPISAPT